MPDDWRDELDTPATFEAVTTFEGGQVSYLKPRRLQENQSALLQNCEIAAGGQVSTRFGTAYLGDASMGGSKVDAIGFLNAVSTSHIYEAAIANGHLYYNNGGVWTSLSSAITTSGIPSLVQGADKLYLASGNVSGSPMGASMWQWDGTTLTQLDGDTNLFPTVQGPRGATILLWHNDRLVAAGPNIRKTSTDPVTSDAIYFSNFLDGTVWGLQKEANSLRVGAGDGVPIVAVVPWVNFTLAVLKRHSVWILNADPTMDVSDMPIQLVHGSVGCVARKTAVQVGADVYFLADDGVRSLAFTAASETQHQLSTALSYPVQDYINRINWAQVGNTACATFWRNLYMLAVPLDSSTTNNYVLVYNTVTQSWAGIWLNLPVNCFGSHEVSAVSRLMMGLGTASRVIDYNDYIQPSNWVDATFQDYDASAVQPRVVTKSYMLNDPMAIKIAKGGELEYNNSRGTLKISPIIDEVAKGGIDNNASINVTTGGFTVPCVLTGSPDHFTIFSNGLSQYRFDLMRYGEFREMQLDVQGLTGGRKELRQLSMAGFVRPSLIGNS